MRMALAGLPVEVIKVFGRWASEAVMAYLRESIVQGKGALVTRAIQEGLQALPEPLKLGTAAAHTPAPLKAGTRASTKRKCQETELEPAEFRLAHPRQQFVVQKSEQEQLLHRKGVGCTTICGWRWVSEGGRPRRRIKKKHALCAKCDFTGLGQGRQTAG